MSYYYLIASLPALEIGQTPMSADAFDMRCQSELSPRDFQTVQSLNNIPFPQDAARNTFVNAWNNQETQLRNAVAKVRASKRRADVSHVLRPHGGFSTLIENMVENVWAQKNPLERERGLDQLRWKLVEELQGPDPFSFKVVLSYAVKRKIAERWSLMDADAGWQKAQEAIEQEPEENLRQQDPETADQQQVGSQNRGNA